MKKEFVSYLPSLPSIYLPFCKRPIFFLNGSFYCKIMFENGFLAKPFVNSFVITHQCAFWMHIYIWTTLRQFSQFLSTELGSLIGNSTQCGNVEIQHFSATLILREINLGLFQNVRNCSFNNFEGLESWFLEKFHTWKCQKLQKITIQRLILKWSK